MSLRHPENKMSKSSDDINGTIYFNDSKESILKKFKSSVTDSENIIKYDPELKPGISNLIEIYAAITDKEIKDSEEEFQNLQYGEFKIAVAETVVDYLEPIKKKYEELTTNDIEDIVEKNLNLAHESAADTIMEVEEALGIN
jgi:tryptophanyl-tRNA synthetase